MNAWWIHEFRGSQPQSDALLSLFTDEATEARGGLGTCPLPLKVGSRARPSSRPEDCKGTWNHVCPAHRRPGRLSQAAYFYCRERRPPMVTTGSAQTPSYRRQVGVPRSGLPHWGSQVGDPRSGPPSGLESKGLAGTMRCGLFLTTLR